MVHHGVTGAVVGPGHQAADVLGRSLEDRFHPAVGQVADPSGHAVFLGEPPAGIAEEDTLDPAGDQDAVADHKQTVRRAGPGRSAGRGRDSAGRGRDLVRVGAGFGGPSGEGGAELVGVDGFGEVVVHAGVEAALFVLGEGSGGHGDDRDVLVRAFLVA